MPDENKGDLYIRGLSRGLRDLFKSACAKNGTDMKKEIVCFLKAYIEESNRVHIGGDGETSKAVRIAKKRLKPRLIV